MVPSIKTIDQIDVRGKRVLVRLDVNSEIHKGRLIPSERLSAPLATIRELQKKQAKVVILAHQGRPGSDDFTSLRAHGAFLKKHLARFRFVPDVIGKKALDAISSLKEGEVLLLDNVRSVPDELAYTSSRPNLLVDTLAPLFEGYVNDAFSVSHREQASVTGFARRLPSAMGRVFEREFNAVQKLGLSHSLMVLGGSKPEDNIELLKTAKGNVLASGLFGPFCLMALGTNLGKQNELMKDALNTYAPVIKTYKSKLILPTDLAIARGGKRFDARLDEFPVASEILDLGIETIERYAREIMSAPAVFFKGLAGVCSEKQYSVGTEALLRALLLSEGFTVVSGGHTGTMIEQLKLPKKKFGYVSLSGGALIHYLAKGTLPGIEALAHAN